MFARKIVNGLSPAYINKEMIVLVEKKIERTTSQIQRPRRRTGCTGVQTVCMANSCQGKDVGVSLWVSYSIPQHGSGFVTMVAMYKLHHTWQAR